ncbi:MAG TPA: CAP domain-containing protein [Patescibacteria group bacterium]|nr:CAP domain-containing protein [Patescibacteria group bacterium]
MVSRARPAKHQHKRHGYHQKRTRPFLRVYSPYIPLLMIVGFGLAFSSYWQPRTSHNGVLAYASSMSVSDLLSGTNQQRAANGVANLNLNSQLDSAAQAKANDMVARNYWSHNTPDGSPPWVFITNAGYQYKSAGENLAYGFSTSADTIAGWMNSPEHKANLLGTGYSDVGFGFANSPDFNGSGPETVVVAEYASPLVVPAPAATAAPPAPKAAAPAPAPTLAPEDAPTPQAAPPKPAVATSKPSTVAQSAVKEPSTQRVSRLATLTKGSAPWVASFVSIITIAGVAALILRHGLALRKTLLKGERYVLHHMVFDVTIVSLIWLSLVISHTAGFIR